MQKQRKEIKSYKLWNKLFPVKIRRGMYVKCEDGRFREGFVIGKVTNILSYSRYYSCLYLAIELKTFPNYIVKRDSTVMCEVTLKEFTEWIKKKEESLGWVSIYLNGEKLRIKRRTK